jgi:hypothetical protein
MTETAERVEDRLADFTRDRGRASVMTARLRRHEEEHHREAGWLHALTQ